MKKFAKKLLNICLSFLAILFCLVIVLQAAILCGTFWLNGESGQAWVKSKIDTALANTNYHFEYRKIGYSLNGLAIHDAKLSDDGGAISDIDHAALTIDLSALTMRKLSVSLKANTVVVYRLPANNKDVESAPLKAFEVPDLYFRTFALNNLSIQTLDIRQDVSGQALTLSPRIEARIDLKDAIQFKLNAKILQPGDAVAWMPEDITGEGSFKPQELTLDLKKFEAISPSYTIQSEGRAGLGTDGLMEISASAASSSLDTLTGHAGEFEIKLKADGKTSSPNLHLDGHASIAELQAKGLTPVIFQADIENLKSGKSSIKTSYRDLPLEFSANLDYAAPVLNITDLSLKGPDLTANGTLQLSTDTKLAQGNIHTDIKNLKTYAELAGQDISGKIAADLSLQSSEAKTQSANLKIKLQKTAYEAYKISNANIGIEFPNILSPWPAALDLKAQDISLTDSAKIKNLTILLSKNEGDAYSLSLKSEGALPQIFKASGTARLKGLAQNKPEAENINAKITLQNSSLNLTGAINQETANLKLNATRFALKSLPVALPDAVKNTDITGAATLTGELKNPKLTVDLTSGLVQTTKKAPPLTLKLSALYEDKNLNARIHGNGKGINKLDGDINIPIGLSLQPYAFDLPKDGRLNGKVLFDLDGAVFANAFLPADHKFLGHLNGNANIEGTIDQPDIKGALNLTKGRYTYLPYEVDIRDMALKARLDGTKISLNNFSANDGEAGSILASGKTDIKNAADTDVRITVKNYHAFKSDMANGRMDANLKIAGTNKGYMIGGDISTAEFQIMIPEQFRSNIPQLNIVKPEASKTGATQNISLDIKFHAPRRVFVRGWGLDAEFGGTLNAAGTLDAPTVNGNLESIRGRYEEFNRRFNLPKANLRFQGAVPPSPYLDIEATTKIDDITASVLLQGSVVKPEIKFASTPSLPQDEILSRILFGKEMVKITPFQAIQLAQTVQKFSGNGGGGFDPLSMLRSATGLDDISVNTDESGGSSVGVGKYLTENVYLELESGAGDASSNANIEIEVTPSMSVESKIGQDAQAGAGVFWSHDY